MTLDLFFNNNKKNVSSLPTQTEYDIPEKFSTATWNSLKSMTADEFYIFMEDIRQWILAMYNEKNINTILMPKSVDEIITGFKNLYQWM
jgi:hypothetical protein